VDDARLGRHEESAASATLRVVDHLLRREDLRPLVARTPSPGSRSRTRVDEQVRRRAPRLPALDVRRAGCRRGRGTRRARSSACGRSPSRARARGTCPAGRGSPVSGGIASITDFALPEVQQ
jgi:hypothetical protein